MAPFRFGYFALIYKEKDTYSVMFPDFPGLISAGNDIEEALSKAREGLIFHIQGLLLGSYPIPFPTNLIGIQKNHGISKDIPPAIVAIDINIT